MAYDLSTRLFIENGPAIQAARAAAAHRSSIAYLAWRSLNEDRRMALVEKALAATANDDQIDCLPVAL